MTGIHLSTTLIPMVIEPPIEKLSGGESENLLEDGVNKRKHETTTYKMPNAVL